MAGALLSFASFFLSCEKIQSTTLLSAFSGSSGGAALPAFFPPNMVRESTRGRVPGTVGIGIGAFKTVNGGVPVIEMRSVRSPLYSPLLVSRGTQPSSRRFPEDGLALKEESGEGPLPGRGVRGRKGGGKTQSFEGETK